MVAPRITQKELTRLGLEVNGDTVVRTVALEATPDAAKAGDQDRDRLATLEQMIAKWFGEIGRALKSIRQEKLYRDEYTTFENYCKKRWNFTPQYANKLIKAADVIEKSGNNSFQSPGNVSQALALSKVPETRRKEVLAKAGKDAKDQDRKMTAKDIAKNELAIKKAEMARTKKQSPGGGRESSSDMSSEVNVFYNVSITSLSEVSAGIKHLLDVLKINVTTTSRKPESTLTCHPSTNEIEGVLGTLGHYLAEHHTTDFTVRITG